MKMNSLHRVAASIVALVSVFAAISCVQQEYEISEDNLNLEVTVFQEGTEIPLGSTGELNMEDLMESFNEGGSSAYLEASGEDGEYCFDMSESLDFSDYLTESGEIQSEPIVKFIDLSSVRDMLNFGESAAALDNARLCVDFETNISSSPTANLIITPYYGDVPSDPIECSLEIHGSNNIDQMNHTKYWLGTNAGSMTDDYIFVEFPINRLLENLPDMIQISMVTSTSKADVARCTTKNTESENPYKLAAECEFRVPLLLDEDSSIEFSYTIQNLGETLNTVFGSGSLILEGQVTNAFPLNIVMTAELLEVSDNAQNSVNLLPEGLHINACKSASEPTTTNINIELTSTNLGNLTNPSAIRFNFVATGNGNPITKDAYLDVELQVRIPGGMDFNLNDFLSGIN